MLSSKQKTVQKQMLWNKHPFITEKAVVFKHPAFFVGNCRRPVLLTGTVKGET